MSIGLSFWGFPSPFALLPASCLPLCLDVARYAFDKGDSQSARQQNEIALDSNDRFGFKRPKCPHPARPLRPQRFAVKRSGRVRREKGRTCPSGASLRPLARTGGGVGKTVQTGSFLFGTFFFRTSERKSTTRRTVPTGNFVRALAPHGPSGLSVLP